VLAGSPYSIPAACCTPHCVRAQCSHASLQLPTPTHISQTYPRTLLSVALFTVLQPPHSATFSPRGYAPAGLPPTILAKPGPNTTTHPAAFN
jgi:hypothetical protein